MPWTFAWQQSPTLQRRHQRYVDVQRCSKMVFTGAKFLETNEKKNKHPTLICCSLLHLLLSKKKRIVRTREVLTLPMAVVCVPVVMVPVFMDTLSEASTDMSDTEKPPRSNAKDEEDSTGCLVVRGTFLDDGQSLMQRFRKLRRAKTDVVPNPEVYEPGKFSEAHVPSQTQTDQTGQACQTSNPAEHCTEICENQKETRKGKERTTVMLRNLPNNYTRQMFLQMLDDHGLKGKYDFAYLPCDFYRDANLGYAFVNMVDGKAVDELWKVFHGFSEWALPTSKVCEVSWSGPHQGFKAHIERYRNSPVMHKSVPDEYKPVIFKNGVRKPFPKSTKKVKAPF